MSKTTWPHSFLHLFCCCIDRLITFGPTFSFLQIGMLQTSPLFGWSTLVASTSPFAAEFTQNPSSNKTSMLARSIHSHPNFMSFGHFLTFDFLPAQQLLIQSNNDNNKTNSDRGSQAIESSSLYFSIIFANDYSYRSITVRHFFTMLISPSLPSQGHLHFSLHPSRTTLRLGYARSTAPSLWKDSPSRRLYEAGSVAIIL